MWRDEGVSNRLILGGLYWPSLASYGSRCQVTSRMWGKGWCCAIAPYCRNWTLQPLRAANLFIEALRSVAKRCEACSHFAFRTARYFHSDPKADYLAYSQFFLSKSFLTSKLIWTNMCRLCTYRLLLVEGCRLKWQGRTPPPFLFLVHITGFPFLTFHRVRCFVFKFLNED